MMKGGKYIRAVILKIRGQRRRYYETQKAKPNPQFANAR